MIEKPDPSVIWPMAWALFTERMEEARNAPDVMFDGQEVLDVLNDCLAKALRSWAHPQLSFTQEMPKP